MYAGLRRDPWFLAVLLVGTASALPSFVPLLPAATVDRYNDLCSDPIMIALAMAAAMAGLGRVLEPVERRFWTLMSCGLGLFLAVELGDFLPPEQLGAHGPLFRNVLFLGLYVCFAVALELKPDLAGGSASLRTLETGGIAILGSGLLAYFILIPESFGAPVFRGSVPSLLLYTVLDGYLVMRLGWLVRATTNPRWRATWLLLLLTAACWLLSDGTETLRWAGFIGPTAMGRLLDVMWLPPYLGIVGAARLRHTVEAPSTDGEAAARTLDKGVFRGAPIWLQAATLPILHVILQAAGALDPAAAPAQQMAAFGVFLAIGPLALVHQRRIETDNRTLQAVQARAQEAEQRAYRDALTGLPNRYLLLDHLNLALSQASRSGTRVAVLFLDLDRFKLVNDSLGHATGDRLLVDVAGRLLTELRRGDTLARLGGDEFVVVAPGLENASDAMVVARKLLESLRPPFVVDGSQVFLTVSVGVSLHPDHGSEADALLAAADLAMYRAKELGRDGVELFQSTMATDASGRLVLETALHRAEQRGEFALHFQPVVELSSRRVCGFEALLRWQHPELGILAPADFLEVAEATGIVARLTPWLLRTACAEASGWKEAGTPGLRVAVNLSARQFLNADLVRHVEEALRSSGLDASRLELEITETVAMQNPDRAVQSLRALKDLGVRISIDDFGTGYSSLAYLKLFPIDSLKIDRSFVRAIQDDAADVAIAATVVAMARTLGLDVVAEGVELEAQRSVLVAQGCGRGQGYLFGAAVPAARVRDLLADQSRSVSPVQ